MAANTEIIDARVTQVHIDDIRLGRMMVPRQNSQDVLRLIPVWDFYGYNIVKNTHPEETEKRNILATASLPSTLWTAASSTGLRNTKDKKRECVKKMTEFLFFCSPLLVRMEGAAVKYIL